MGDKSQECEYNALKDWSSTQEWYNPVPVSDRHDPFKEI